MAPNLQFSPFNICHSYDSWEMAHGLNRFDLSDAAADSDADGASNLEEYKACTDPQDKGSAFLVLLAEVKDAQVRFVINTAAGLYYRVEPTSSLRVPDSFPVGDAVTGTGGAREVLLKADVNTRLQFYRGRLIVPDEQGSINRGFSTIRTGDVSSNPN